MALQNTALCFRDPDLRSSLIDRDPVLGPKPISGNFASVFSATTVSGRRHAIKCFTQNVAEQEFRYDAISAHLATLKGGAPGQPWHIGFQYQPDGVMVEGEWFPILKMEWAAGHSLIRWIDDHHSRPDRVAALAKVFATLAADLSAAGIAHGDLQHGNLLIADDGTLRLVDYDGMFVPALSGQQATEKGHRNYQSPQRSDRDFGPELDRFSVWNIYLSLISVSVDPSLWSRLHEPDGEFLLLAEEDFQSPSASLRFGALLSHPDRRISDLAERLRTFSSQPLSAVPELTPTTSAASTAPPPVKGGMPSWLADHQQPRQGAPASGPPPQGLSPAPPPVTRFHGRRRTDFVLAVLALVLITSGAILAAPPSSFLPALLLCASAFLLIHQGWRSRTETVVLRRHLKDLDQQIREYKEPEKEWSVLQTEIQRFEQQEAGRDSRDSTEIQRLQQKQHKEAAQIKKDLDKRIATINKDLGDLDRRSQEQQRAALAALQTRHIRDRLSRDSIRQTAQLSHMGPGTTDSFLAAGIRSAADFTGVRYQTGGQYGNVSAYFRLVSGREVRVYNVGEKRAKVVENWRRKAEARARSSAPSSLPKAESQAITSRTAAERRRLQGDRKKAQADSSVQRDRLLRTSTAEQKRLQDAQIAARTDASSRRAEFQHRRARLTTDIRDLSQLRAARAVGTGLQRRLGRIRYVGFVISGK
ncbi:hypothetical protein [Streptomyces xiamenensis]|uniref:hypothetical protein n=1 Tax=Streptomyces xiamenensis TaxID=408015 RepID=UPI0037D43B4A